ncbi:MAG TPA: glycoside hydrolase domain-containing protein [Candidatus Acidoferrum sp.]|nr:glycoside hydrolase domain-containing protein [Candidatus Acidoferrum sp.]
MLSLRLAGAVLFLCALALVPSLSPRNTSAPSPPAYFGFDRNDYPADDALPALRKTFSFASYWLSAPPGEKRNSWLGKRALLQSQGFGLAVLFNGRASRALRNTADARQKGMLDAQNAVKSAQQEGFAIGTVVFLDIEEGGRLPAPYHRYLQAWSNALAKAGYRAGVYCSAIPVDEGQGVHITTAQDIQAHVTSPGLVYWVYNDACPPAPGCAFPANPPPPAQSGFSSAAIWQYAQSPRRKEFTVRCAASYAADGNCYAPRDAQHRWFLDANVATTPDPSSSH